MMSDCDRFKNAIPMDLMGDLDAAAQRELHQHLAECKHCARELALYGNTLVQMRSLADEPVPRHFFVYPPEQKVKPWQLLFQLPLAWKAAFAAVVVFLGLFASFAATRLHIRTENGALLIAFGRIPPSRALTAPQPALDLQALETNILRAVEEKNRREKLEWVRTLRNEFSNSQRDFTHQQRKFMETALAELEARMTNNITATALALENRTDKSLGEMYRAISQKHDRDYAAFNTRIAQLAIAGETKSSQTDEILVTLLQVAELKMK